MNAPEPTFTSITSDLVPSAIFFERIDAVMSGMLSTVPVTSRSEYSVLSAGATSAVWPIIAMPVFLSATRNSSSDRFTRKPGMLSNLSSVPPV